MQTENEKKNGEIDFLSAKEIIIKEISVLPEIKSLELQLPEIYPEKNEIKVSFAVDALTKEIIFDCLQVIKNYIENVRVHTFEQGYYCFQALNDNLFENKSIIDNIKFRFIALKSQYRIEISKKGDLKRDEIYTIISLFKFLNSGSLQKSQNPREILNRLGINVFDPEEAEKSGSLLSFD
ncbi:MAG: AAA family ATPase, partial [Leptospira sp.]|nr:AAA family ATPase [Leptospira sp.]